MGIFDRIVNRLSAMLNIVGMSIIMVMMFLTTIDVVGRKVFNHPIKGGLELSEFMLAAVIWLGLAYTTVMRGHISMTLLVSRFSPRTQAFFDIPACLAGLLYFVLIGWQGFEMVLTAHQLGDVTDVLRLPVFLFRVLVPVGSFVVCLVLINQLSSSFRQAKKPS